MPERERARERPERDDECRHGSQILSAGDAGIKGDPGGEHDRGKREDDAPQRGGRTVRQMRERGE